MNRLKFLRKENLIPSEKIKNDKIAGILKNICYFFCFLKQKVYFCIYKIKLLP
jgi:hypothetical protein